jgi:hypothetical protein
MISILIVVISGAFVYFTVMKIIRVKELKYIEDLVFRKKAD